MHWYFMCSDIVKKAQFPYLLWVADLIGNKNAVEAEKSESDSESDEEDEDDKKTKAPPQKERSEDGNLLIPHAVL